MLEKLTHYRLFRRPVDFKQPRQIIVWWETRRLAFNLIIGTTGLLTCFLLMGLSEFTERKFSQPIFSSGSPILELAAVVIFGMMANICYTGGWISDLIVRNVWKERAGSYGEIAFMLGLFFSICLTLAPVFYFLVVAIVKLINS